MGNGKVEKSDNHHQENLAKYGYKLYMKYNTPIMFLYFWLQTKTKYKESSYDYYYYLTFGSSKCQNHSILFIYSLNFVF